MILRIRHLIEFRYDRAVFIEPLIVRLRPHCDCAQKLHEFSLRLAPSPAGQREVIDLHHNVATTAWFSGEHERLTIEARSDVEPLLENPFDYLVSDPGVMALPMRSGAMEDPAIEPYLFRDQPDPAIDELARQVAERSGGRTIEFLSHLTSHLHDRCRVIVRPQGDPLPPAETLGRGVGACRDLAVVFMDACRAVGIPARFVSGYQHHEPASTEDRDMHAWAQVYLPGAGWRGYDPTGGLATADSHVTVAAAAHPAHAAPTRGTFRGATASSLRYEVEVERVGQ